MASEHRRRAQTVRNTGVRANHEKDLQAAKTNLWNHERLPSLASSLRLLGDAPESRSGDTVVWPHIHRDGCEDAREPRVGHRAPLKRSLRWGACAGNCILLVGIFAQERITRCTQEHMRKSPTHNSTTMR